MASKDPQEHPFRIATRDELFSVLASHEATVEVPLLGISVRMRQLTRRDQYEIRQAARRDGELDIGLLDGLLIARAVVDPVLSEEDVELLREGRADGITQLLELIAAHNAQTPEVRARLEADFRPESGGA